MLFRPSAHDPLYPRRNARLGVTKAKPHSVIVAFITGHTTSTDPSRSYYITSVGGRLKPTHTEGGSRRRGGAEQLLLNEQPLVDGHRTRSKRGRHLIPMTSSTSVA